MLSRLLLISVLKLHVLRILVIKTLQIRQDVLQILAILLLPPKTLVLMTHAFKILVYKISVLPIVVLQILATHLAVRILLPLFTISVMGRILVLAAPVLVIFV
jgi:hypothetical protein